MRRFALAACAATAAALLIAGCATAPAPTPAKGAQARLPCEQLAGFAYPALRIVSVQAVAAGRLRLPGIARLLLPWPAVARYQAGDPEQAASFRCLP